MIDELMELSGFVEQFEQTFVAEMVKELEPLEKRKMFLDPKESAKRDTLIRKLDFCKALIVSIKTTQEYAVLGKIVSQRFLDGIETNKMLDSQGNFRKTLLPQQVEFMNEFINKLK